MGENGEDDLLSMIACWTVFDFSMLKLSIASIAITGEIEE
jgi:hypothetical protein